MVILVRKISFWERRAMKSFLIFIISMILTVKFKDSFISLITGIIAFFAFIYFLFVSLSNSKTDDTTDNEIVKAKPRKAPKKKLSKYELELFARQCNSYLEYEDKKELWNSESDEI